MKDHELQKILRIGIALSAEKDYNRLLEMILENVMSLTNCDAGTLYLRDKDSLVFKILRNNTMKTYQGGDGQPVNLPPVPITRENVCSLALIENRTISIEDVRTCRDYDLSGPIRYDAMTGYHTKSVLVVPMKNREEESVGVLQLINALDGNGEIVSFSPDLVIVVESVASQAAVAIQNMQYMKAIEGLFHSFVRVMSSAIDKRTPYNAAHTRHMASYGEHFINYLNKKSMECGKGPLFSKGRREELLMSIWLHDIGKLVTPLEVMNKESRLKPEDLIRILHRFEVISLKNKIDCLEGRTDPEASRRFLMEIERAKELVEKANIVGFLSDELLDEIKRLGERTYQDEEGTKPLLTEEEIQTLAIRKGTLTEKERGIMESHVTMTEKFLSEIEFSKEYRHVPFWASSHHEFMNGTGYPRKLKNGEIPIEVRIITILDIFDALTADDRPYKPGLPVAKALGILRDMAEKEGKLDPVLTEQFIESRCWEA